MTRETLYSPPGGEGPSVVAMLDCIGCKHFRSLRGGREERCAHPLYGGKTLAIPSLPTPDSCPIFAADPAAWERRLRGET